MISLSAEFHGYEGPRDIITIITQGEKDPLVMGFKLLGDNEPVVLGASVSEDVMVVPDDQIEGVDIDFEQMQRCRSST